MTNAKKRDSDKYRGIGIGRDLTLLFEKVASYLINYSLQMSCRYKPLTKITLDTI